MNRNKHIWEGWTVGDFINDLELTYQYQTFTSKDEIKNGVNQNSLITRNIYQKYISIS